MTGLQVRESLRLGRSAPRPARPTRLPRIIEDRHGWIAAGLYLIVIVWYEHGAVAHLGSVCNCANMDPTQWMWSWKWIPYALLHGENPLLTNEIWPGAPVDLAAITLSPALAIPGAPLTALFGPIAAYDLVMLAAPVLSGWAAYRLCRYVSGAPWASVLAGYLYGFSAFELGHLLGHLNLVYVFVPPLLALVVLRQLDGEISRRRAAIQATLLLLIQLGISTEILFDMSYLGALAIAAAYVVAPARRSQLRQAVLVLAVAAVATALIASEYLYQALRGPEGSKFVGIYTPADLLSYVVPTQVFALGGGSFTSLSSRFYTGNPFEQNNYLGLPLIFILGAFVVSGRRRRSTWVILVVTLVAFVLSLGVTLTVDGHPEFSLPFHILEQLPFFDLTLPSRLGVFVSLGAALATALWLATARSRRGTRWRWLVALAAVAVLFPNVAYPSPSAVADTPGYLFASSDLRRPGRINAYDQPAFFTHGIYRRYLVRNEVVLTYPVGQFADDMLWQADTDMYFRLLAGYLGYPPPSYSDNPLVYQLFNYATPPPVQDLGALQTLLQSEEVGAVLIQDGQGGTFPALLTAIGWRQLANVGGITVFGPAAGPS